VEGGIAFERECRIGPEPAIGVAERCAAATYIATPRPASHQRDSGNSGGEQNRRLSGLSSEANWEDVLATYEEDVEAAGGKILAGRQGRSDLIQTPVEAKPAYDAVWRRGDPRALARARVHRGRDRRPFRVSPVHASMGGAPRSRPPKFVVASPRSQPTVRRTRPERSLTSGGERSRPRRSDFGRVITRGET
jgi:hypothetical protein